MYRLIASDESKPLARRSWKEFVSLSTGNDGGGGGEYVEGSCCCFVSDKVAKRLNEELECETPEEGLSLSTNCPFSRTLILPGGVIDDEIVDDGEDEDCSDDKF